MRRRYSSLAEYLEHVETQEQLAERLAVSQTTISRAKYGHGSYKLFKRISEATGVPLDSFGRNEAA